MSPIVVSMTCFHASFRSTDSGRLHASLLIPRFFSQALEPLFDECEPYHCQHCLDQATFVVSITIRCVLARVVSDHHVVLTAILCFSFLVLC